MASTVELTFADDMALNDWIASETTATGAAWLDASTPIAVPDEKTLNTSEIIDTLRALREPLVYRARAHRGYREPTGRVLLVPGCTRPRPVL